MHLLKGFITILFVLAILPLAKADSVDDFENPLQYYKQHYTKKELKEIAELNYAILIQIEKKTKYPPKLSKEQGSIRWYHKLPSILINEADALGINGRCFFGGWKTVQGDTWCHEPWRFNHKQDLKDFGPTYNSHHFCGGKNLFRCNPTLFGMPKDHDPKLGNNPNRGICIKIDSYDHVTRDCTRAATKHLDSFVAEIEKDPKKLSQFLTHTADILRYCEADKLDYCEELKAYLVKVTKRAADCEKALAKHAAPKPELPLDEKDMEKITEELTPKVEERSAEVVIEKPEPIVEKVEPPKPPSLDEKIKKYSDDPQTKALISRMRGIYNLRCNNSRCSGEKGNVASGSCWRHVKHGLMSAGYADGYLKVNKTEYPYTATPSAKNAGKDFFEKPYVGFTNLKDMPEYKNINSSNAPVGAILVYEGGKHGHVEVKAGNNEYISDFRSNRAHNVGNKYRETTRKLIGVYVKID